MTEKNVTSAIKMPRTNSKQHQIFDDESTQANCSRYYVVCVTAGWELCVELAVGIKKGSDRSGDVWQRWNESMMETEGNNSVPHRSYLAAVHCLCYLKHKPNSIKEKNCATMRVSHDEQQDASEQEKKVDGVGWCGWNPLNWDVNFNIEVAYLISFIYRGNFRLQPCLSWLNNVGLCDPPESFFTWCSHLKLSLCGNTTVKTWRCQ